MKIIEMTMEMIGTALERLDLQATDVWNELSKFWRVAVTLIEVSNHLIIMGRQTNIIAIAYR